MITIAANRAVDSPGVHEPATRSNVREIHLDIGGQPAHRAGCAERNSRLGDTRRAAPEAGYVRLEAFPLHDLAKISEAPVRIGERQDEPDYGVEVIGEIVACDVVPGAEIPNPGLADDLPAAGTGAISRALAVGSCRLLIEDARNLVGVEGVAGKAQCGKGSGRLLRVRHRCCREARRARP
jgi:hypothetical protein